MLFAWLIRFVEIFIVLTVVYLGLSIYKRWEERRRLTAEFAAQTAEGSAPGSVVEESQEAFVRRGIREYERSLRKKLLLGVYLVPFALLALLVLVAQWD